MRGRVKSYTDSAAIIFLHELIAVDDGFIQNKVVWNSEASNNKYFSGFLA